MVDECPESALLLAQGDTQNQSAAATSMQRNQPIAEGGIQLTPSKKDLDAILQDMLDAEDQPIENDESSNACSDMSSLLPFGNVIPSDCEESITTGLDLSRTNSENTLSAEGQPYCPDEVYIEAKSTPTPYGSYFNRRRSSDQSISSNESNSLSSIFDSMGWSAQKKVHHSRGLDKNKKGMLYNFLASNKDSSHNDREGSHRRRDGNKASQWKAAILGVALVFFIKFLNDFTAKDESIESTIINENAFDQIGTPKDEAYTAGFGEMFAIPGIPIDERPVHAIDHYDSLPKDSSGKIQSQIRLPKPLSVVSEPSLALNLNSETPLFWVVPKSGASLIMDAMSSCSAQVLAGEYGTAEHSADADLKFIYNGKLKYVNVETFTTAGIGRAKEVGLVKSRKADVIASPLFLESLQLFDDTYRARPFTLIRHPIYRAESMFEKHKKENPKLKENLSSYARSRYVENNYLVRYLSGDIEGDIDEKNLKVAKEVLKRFVIGIAEDLDKSMKRFQKYFGFPVNAKCDKGKLHKKLGRQEVKEGSVAWNLLMHQNKFDMELYKYATELFERQGANLF